MYEGDATQSYNRTYVCSVLRQTSSRRPRETVKLMVLGSWSCPSKVNGTIKYSEAKFIVICKIKSKTAHTRNWPTQPVETDIHHFAENSTQYDRDERGF